MMHTALSERLFIPSLYQKPPNPLAWAGTPHTSAGCPEPIQPGLEHLQSSRSIQILWVACASLGAGKENREAMPEGEINTHLSTLESLLLATPNLLIALCA